MASQKRTPTNADLANEIRDLKTMVKPLIDDVQQLKDWKLREDAFKSALKQVKQDEDRKKRNNFREGESKTKLELTKNLVTITGIIILILLAYANSRGIHP